MFGLEGCCGVDFVGHTHIWVMAGARSTWDLAYITVPENGGHDVGTRVTTGTSLWGPISHGSFPK